MKCNPWFILSLSLLAAQVTFPALVLRKPSRPQPRSGSAREHGPQRRRHLLGSNPVSIQVQVGAVARVPLGVDPAGCVYQFDGGVPLPAARGHAPGDRLALVAPEGDQAENTRAGVQ